jgi:hypothetical protein
MTKLMAMEQEFDTHGLPAGEWGKGLGWLSARKRGIPSPGKQAVVACGFCEKRKPAQPELRGFLFIPWIVKSA